ncbi:MAG: GDP-mannose 4,6-dehydratase, partial [Flavobacteriales bacterium CG_4_9_14_3_um_filter_32_8]
MKTAIISGISGQDGAYLAKLLVDKNYRVVGLIRPLQSKNRIGLAFLGIQQQVELQEINLLNKTEVEKLIQQIQPDEFYNLAAQSSVGLSFTTPVDTFEFNTISVINILEAIRKFSINTKYYQASSSEMFGNIGIENLPLKETVLFHPVSPYGISKASAHWITVNYREAYDLKACCGILFNHESCLRGENFVIKKIIRTALEIKNNQT